MTHAVITVSAHIHPARGPANHFLVKIANRVSVLNGQIQPANRANVWFVLLAHPRLHYSPPYLISILRMRTAARIKTKMVKTSKLGTETQGEVAVTTVASGPSLIGTGASVCR